MKYLVMECHPAYAVLMDEESRFLSAANLNYTVGQTVTDPVLLGSTEPDRRSLIKQSVIVKITAAAACLMIICTGGYSYYSRNIAVSSVVVISAAADIEMHLNSRGQVISLESSSPYGQEIINKYNETHRSKGDQNDVASALLELQLDEGIISTGDTVSVYVDKGDESSISALQSELESGLHDIKIDVKPIEKRGHNTSEPVKPSPDNERPDAPVAVTTTAVRRPPAPSTETTVSTAAERPTAPAVTKAPAPAPETVHTAPATKPAKEKHTEPPHSKTTAAPPPAPPRTHTTNTAEPGTIPQMTVTTPVVTKSDEPERPVPTEPEVQKPTPPKQPATEPEKPVQPPVTEQPAKHEPPPPAPGINEHKPAPKENIPEADISPAPEQNNVHPLPEDTAIAAEEPISDITIQ